MSLHPRPQIEDLKVCPHGGPDYAELERMGFAPDEVLDFSVSANPFGPPPEVKEALNSTVIDRYPDSNATVLKRALATNLNINPENLIIGNGSTEIIRLIATAYLERSDTIIIPQPTFGEYEIACRIAGSKILSHCLRQGMGFKLDINEFSHFIEKQHPRAIFLCNPNNPTGQYLSRGEIEQIASSCQDALLIMDEAYVSFAEKPWDSLDLIDSNIIILRSMTKDYTLAGLRLGYAVSNPEIIDTLTKVCPPWNVNAVAQTAGIIAVQYPNYIEQCREQILQAREFLIRELTQLGLSPLPSAVHFFLVEVGDAAQFRQDLLRYGIMVRDCASFGLPQYVRIAPRAIPECENLIDAIRGILK